MYPGKPRVRREWRTVEPEVRLQISKAFRIMVDTPTRAGRETYGEQFWNYKDLSAFHVCNVVGKIYIHLAVSSNNLSIFFHLLCLQLLFTTLSAKIPVVTKVTLDQALCEWSSLLLLFSSSVLFSSVRFHSTLHFLYFRTFHIAFMLRIEKSLLAISEGEGFDIEALPYWDPSKDSINGTHRNDPEKWIFGVNFFGDLYTKKKDDYQVTNVSMCRICIYMYIYISLWPIPLTHTTSTTSSTLSLYIFRVSLRTGLLLNIRMRLLDDRVTCLHLSITTIQLHVSKSNGSGPHSPILKILKTSL